MKFKSLIALLASILLVIPSSALGQDSVLSFECDLAGTPAQMTMAVEYINSHGITATSNGDISGVFPTGVSVYTSGQVIAENARYSFQGENQFADFSAMNWHERFRVEWHIDATRNGVWLAVNPFEDTTYHFCSFKEIVE